VAAEEPITFWIEEIKRGNPAAAEVIWERYFPQLVRIAREKLRGVPGRMADEEDVALSALDSFCRAAEQGCFPDLADRHGLWRLLFRQTARKAVDLARHERREIRGGGRVRGEATLNGSRPESGEQGLARVAGDAVSPEFAVMMADQCRRLLGRLDPHLQTIALAKMEGYGNDEIALRTQRSLRTVERRVQLIRRIWQEEAP
jgi:DNA-directed RNA polymerase specialized sigma24 family protein